MEEYRVIGRNLPSTINHSHYNVSAPQSVQNSTSRHQPVGRPYEKGDIIKGKQILVLIGNGKSVQGLATEDMAVLFHCSTRTRAVKL